MPNAGGAERVNQFSHPHGLGGRLAGWLMVVGNADMGRAAIKALTLGGDECVLEVGFGPGVGVRLLERRLPAGSVAGVDPSEAMLAQATRRNRAAVSAGRVVLRRSTASELPFDDARFDAVVSVNNIQEWPALDEGLNEARRVLGNGGRLSIAVHAWVAKYAKDRGDERRPWADHIAAALERSGFRDVVSSPGRALSGQALYFTARLQ